MKDPDLSELPATTEARSGAQQSLAELTKQTTKISHSPFGGNSSPLSWGRARQMKLGVEAGRGLQQLESDRQL